MKSHLKTLKSQPYRFLNVRPAKSTAGRAQMAARLKITAIRKRAVPEKLVPEKLVPEKLVPEKLVLERLGINPNSPFAVLAALKK